MEIFRNMWRRKFRTLLTVIGISVGIFAFTVMGSLALKFNKMIDGGKKYITGQITISPKGESFTGGMGGGTLPVDTLNKIGQAEGVKAVAPMVSLLLDEPDPDNPTGGGMSIGMPPTIYGMDVNTNFENANWKTMDMKEGKFIDKNNAEDEISIGYTVALDKKWSVGDKVNIRGREFRVVGILDQTMTGPDSYVFMQLKPARELFIESNPFLKSLKAKADEASKITDASLATMSPAEREQAMQARSFNMLDISTMAGVSWKEGEDPEKIVEKIKEEHRNEVVVLSPKKMGEEIDKASATFNAVIFGSAILALIVGLFSIINTMIMSISERTKEIGVKKAIGASNRSIAWEYTLEAGIISIIGGLLGMGLGVLMAVLINQKMSSKGAEIFLVEPGFLIQVVIFSFIIGIIAGVIPAARASKLKVVDAIREL